MRSIQTLEEQLAKVRAKARAKKTAQIGRSKNMIYLLEQKRQRDQGTRNKYPDPSNKIPSVKDGIDWDAT